MEELYYHEDDYCGIELVPMDNEKFIKNEQDEIFNFAEEHRVSNGSFTDVYIRKEHPKKLEEYEIDYIEMDKVLSEITKKYEKVTTGYGFENECENTIGYRFNEINIFIKNNGKYITTIWFDFYLDQLSTAQDLYKILKIIVQDYDLMFVDWSWGFYSRVKYDLELENKLIKIYEELSNK
jgi:hypothetical protein